MTDAPKLRISKIDAAKRQLDCAIDLWFQDGDVVSIHTLAAAAHAVIGALCKKAGNGDLTMAEIVRRHVAPEHFKSSLDAMRGPMNFFKHADRDPHATLEFSSNLSDSLMLLAMRGLDFLGEPRSDRQRVFLRYFSFHKSFMLTADQRDKNPYPRFTPDQIGLATNVPKKMFLDMTLMEFAVAKLPQVRAAAR